MGLGLILRLVAAQLRKSDQLVISSVFDIVFGNKHEFIDSEVFLFVDLKDFRSDILFRRYPLSFSRVFFFCLSQPT
jgi:hypothetical protein